MNEDLLEHYKKKQELIDEYIIMYGERECWTCEIKCKFAYEWGIEEGKRVSKR